MADHRRGGCSHCRKERRLRLDDTLVLHQFGSKPRCPGSFLPPANPTPDWQQRALHAERLLARLETLPVTHVGGRAAVYLAHLQPIVNAAQATHNQPEAADA